ncbi:ATP-dependent RNA helicase RhlB [Teredinibacter haidensis]|uniref:ATP-dependent RNA helicase RhlB n=1 Tax=Teredinibacter haidensis TaxID=2731755 RepID=UPI000948A323|nr:ATP-dependent RNA helicase RhlB [Teredinibacter haidensis]
MNDDSNPSASAEDNAKKTEKEEKVGFKELELTEQINRALSDLGFTHCSPIQAKSLPYSLSGHDVLGKAQTGTGKTAAFLIAVFEDLLRQPAPEERFAGEARALVIAPTRELVMQIAKDATEIGKYTGLQVHALVGGMDFGKQLQSLHSRHVDLLVATPGRLLDMCERREVYLDQVEVMVIDEADRMLDMGFIPQVKRIVRMAPQKTHRQTLLFSATFSDDVLRLAEQWVYEPITVEIEPESIATDTVEQIVYLVSGDEKLPLLMNLITQPDVHNLMIFANRRDQCRVLHERLRNKGFKVGLLSGEIPQGKRVRTLDDFKNGRLQALVATDVAGRGIHIEGISHVVNYTLPDEPEDYVHRIGRTGRAGKSGKSISFACEDDAFRLPAIEELLGRKLHCEQPPEHLLD